MFVFNAIRGHCCDSVNFLLIGDFFVLVLFPFMQNWEILFGLLLMYFPFRCLDSKYVSYCSEHKGGNVKSAANGVNN